MKHYFSLAVLLLSINFNCICQQNNIWMLGYDFGGYPKIGLNFINGTPDTFSLYREMPFKLTDASYCDSNANLKFYSNGIYIANSNHDSLLNSNNFNPGYGNSLSPYGYTQSMCVLFIPKNEDSGLYYVFNKSVDTITYKGLTNRRVCLSTRYSLIDMSLDGGLGGIVDSTKSTVLLDDTLVMGMLTACKHGNGRDWWIISPRYNDSLIYNVLVTPDTMIRSQQIAGTPIYYHYTGSAVFSPDGSKYVIMSQNHILDIFDFDRCSGTLSNHELVTLPDTNYGFLGSAISSDNNFLYVNSYFGIFQIDLTSQPYSSSIIQVAQWDTVYSPTATIFGYSQLAPDGKIYLGTWNGTDILHVIGAPDSAGLSCNVLQNHLKLPSMNLGVPSFPNYNLGPLYGSACDTLSAGVEVFAANNINLQIAPNPIEENVLHVTYKLPQNKGGTLKVFDITGKEIFKYTLPAWSTLQNLNLPMLSDGMYFCTVSSGVYRMSKRFVVMKGEN